MQANTRVGHGTRTGSMRLLRIAFTLAAAALASGALPLTDSGARAAVRTIIVAPSGLSSGDGSLAKPLSLEAAVAPTSPARPGDEILLRGGIYRGAYWSRISGSPSAPIVVRSYPGEWAVFDGNTAQKPSITIDGSDTWFRDFEVTKSDSKRISSQTGAAPRDISRGSDGAYSNGDGIFVYGPRTKLINLVIHDAGDAIGLWDRGTEAEVYGCILYNNGFLSTDKAWGHAVYLHNESGTKLITDSVMFNNWGYGIHGYVPDRNITGVTIEGVTSFGNGSPVDAPTPNIHVGPGSGTLDRIVVRNNVAYHRAAKGENIRLGFASDAQLRQNGSVTVEDNYLLGGRTGLVLQGWKNAAVRNNRFSAAPADPGSADMAKVLTNMTDGGVYRWDGNTYVDANTTSSYSRTFVRARKDLVRGWVGGRLDFPSWTQSTGYDGSSAFSRSTTSPLQVIVRPNRYERGRAFMTVLNQGDAPVVQLDLSGTGLLAGERFEIRDVQNLSGAPVATGVYDGRGVSVPMTTTYVMQSIGGSPTPVRHTPTAFGVFEVRPPTS